MMIPIGPRTTEVRIVVATDSVLPGGKVCQAGNLIVIAAIEAIRVEIVICPLQPLAVHSPIAEISSKERTDGLVPVSEENSDMRRKLPLWTGAMAGSLLLGGCTSTNQAKPHIVNQPRSLETSLSQDIRSGMVETSTVRYICPARFSPNSLPS